MKLRAKNWMGAKLRFLANVGRTFNIWVCSREAKQDVRAFHRMWENFLSKVEYVKWFSCNSPKAQFSSQANSSSYADRVESNDNTTIVKKKENVGAHIVGNQTDIRVEGGSSQPSSVL